MEKIFKSLYHFIFVNVESGILHIISFTAPVDVDHTLMVLRASVSKDPLFILDFIPSSFKYFQKRCNAYKGQIMMIFIKPVSFLKKKNYDFFLVPPQRKAGKADTGSKEKEQRKLLGVICIVQNEDNKKEKQFF